MRKAGASTGPHDYSATLRQLKLLVVVLVVSNVALGLFAFYLLRSTDQRYTALLGRSVPALNDLRELTADLADALRATGTPLLQASEAQRPEMVRRARAAIGQDRQFRATVLDGTLRGEAAKQTGPIREEGDRFDAVCERLVVLVESGQVAQAVQVRDQMLRAAFDSYVNAIGHTAEGIEGSILKANSEMTARTGSMSTVVLGLAGWPVIVLFALLLLTALFVVVLMVLFRGREATDMP